jgi:hypothetical protein
MSKGYAESEWAPRVPMTEGQAETLRRFFKYVEFTPFGCWEWTGGRDSAGYGGFNTGRGHVRSSRWAYVVFRGEIPEGLVVDHLCRNRPCVNPFHLEAVTQRENLMRGQTIAAFHATKTHCKNGHEFTSITTRQTGHGRECRICSNERSKKTRERDAERKRRWYRRRRNLEGGRLPFGD